MATEYKLSYTASEINTKLGTVDETKASLENNYYTSTEVDTKFAETNESVDTKISEANSALESSIATSLVVSLANKADIVDGKVPVEQLPDDIGGGVETWDELGNKPFGETGYYFTQEDIDTAKDYVSYNMDGEELKWYKVTEPINDTLEGWKFSITVDGEDGDLILGDADSSLTLVTLGTGSSYCPYVFNMIEDNEVISSEDIGISSLTIPNKGLYLLDVSTMGAGFNYLQSDDFGIKQLDKKFIPPEIGTWANMPDKPFYETGFSIEWDGVTTEGLPFVELSDGMGFYKVSDIIPTKEELIGATYVGIDGELKPLEKVISDEDIGDYNEYSYGMAPNPYFLMVTQEADVPVIETTLHFTAGTWFIGVGQPMSIDKSELKQIDKKFIPDDITAAVSLTFDEIPIEGSQNPVKSAGIYSAISALKNQVSSTFYYKGTVANYSDLPTSNNTVGDVWNILNADESNGIEAGDNVAWNGTAWNVLAGGINLSNYYTKIEVDSITTNALSNYYTKAEIDNMIGDCDTIINSINTLVGGGNV